MRCHRLTLYLLLPALLAGCNDSETISPYDAMVQKVASLEKQLGAQRSLNELLSVTLIILACCLAIAVYVLIQRRLSPDTPR
jgi:hypothetical protein